MVSEDINEIDPYFSGLRIVSTVPAGRAAKASSVGANTVGGAVTFQGINKASSLNCRNECINAASSNSCINDVLRVPTGKSRCAKINDRVVGRRFCLVQIAPAS